MTIEDFSNTFDILYNNLMSNRAPEVNDYEKSMLLTLAQEDLVKELYNKAFEGSEQARRALDALIVTASVEPDGSTRSGGFTRTTFTLPKGLWYIVRETATVSDEGACLYGKDMPVRPERQDDLSRDLGNPFRGPSSFRALRLDAGGDRKSRGVELYSGCALGKYNVTYLRRPRPILIADFTDDAYDSIHIRGVSTFKDAMDGYDPSELGAEPCELSETVQQDIIVRAATYAKAAFAS